MTSPSWIDIPVVIVIIPCLVLIGLCVWFLLKMGEEKVSRRKEYRKRMSTPQ